MSNQEPKTKDIGEGETISQPFAEASERGQSAAHGSRHLTVQDDLAVRTRSSTVPSQWTTNSKPVFASGMPLDNSQSQFVMDTTGPFGTSTREAFESVGKKEVSDPFIQAQVPTLNIQPPPSTYSIAGTGTSAFHQAEKSMNQPYYTSVHGMHGVSLYSTNQQRYTGTQNVPGEQSVPYYQQTPAQYSQYLQASLQQQSASLAANTGTHQFPGYQAPALQSSPLTVKPPSEFSIFVGQLGPEVDESMLWKVFGPRYQSFIKANLMRNKETGESRGFAFVRFTDAAERDHALSNMNGVFVGNSKMVVGRANKELSKGQFTTVVPGGQAAMNYPPYPPTQASSIQQGFVDQVNLKNESQWFARPEERPNVPAPVGFPSTQISPYGALSSSVQGQSFNPYQQFGTQNVNIVDPANITVFVGGLPIGSTAEQLVDLFKNCGKILHVNIPAGRGCGFVKFETHQQALATIHNMQGVDLNGANLRLSWGKHAR